ncbi:hypothetical protein AVEN_245845-1 [Araneus ventricosus]|uniref:Uncharacterized protein n=1 Tax=Araneus ventricosus TaxID=182803 RepID=A0A4Y2TMQ5_ARAVE|nr:hypothetical protein AVEN_245845-1 [Araneus ventricosus]
MKRNSARFCTTFCADKATSWRARASDDFRYGVSSNVDLQFPLYGGMSRSDPLHTVHHFALAKEAFIQEAATHSINDDPKVSQEDLDSHVQDHGIGYQRTTSSMAGNRLTVCGMGNGLTCVTREITKGSY